VREDDGWRWLRNSSGIVASVCGLIVAPVATVLAVVLLLVPFGLDACEYSKDPGAGDLGIGLDPAAGVTARVPICVTEGAQVLQLVGPERVVLWRAESTQPVSVESFVVGVTPEGFTEIVPLAGPLDPETSYDVQMLTDLTTDSPTTTIELEAGAHTEFRPVDLAPDRIFFATHSVPPDEFDDAACIDRSE
jgi:hypothetical protein